MFCSAEVCIQGLKGLWESWRNQRICVISTGLGSYRAIL